MTNRNREIQAISGLNLFKKPGQQNQQFPGQNMVPGITIEQIREFIKRQKKSKGYQIQSSTTIETVSPINSLSGDARLLLGFHLFPVVADPSDATMYPNTMEIQVNQEIIVESVGGYSLSPAFMTDEYYFFPRPLSGQDTIVVKLGATTVSRNYIITFFYI